MRVLRKPSARRGLMNLKGERMFVPPTDANEPL